jgi:hypothetical protein
MRVRRRQFRWLLAIALLLPGLAACEEDQLNAAAIVDDTKITVTEVQGALEKVRTERERLGVPPEQPTGAAAVEVTRRIHQLIYEKAAADLGIELTEGELAVQEAELRARAGGQERFEQTQLADYGTLEAAESTIRMALLAAKMGEKLADGRSLTTEEIQSLVREKLTAAAQSMHIRVNPRYGTFDPVSGEIQPFEYDYFRKRPA